MLSSVHETPARNTHHSSSPSVCIRTSASSPRACTTTALGIPHLRSTGRRGAERRAGASTPSATAGHRLVLRRNRAAPGRHLQSRAAAHKLRCRSESQGCAITSAALGVPLRRSGGCRCAPRLASASNLASVRLGLRCHIATPGRGCSDRNWCAGHRSCNGGGRRSLQLPRRRRRRSTSCAATALRIPHLRDTGCRGAKGLACARPPCPTACSRLILRRH